MTDDQHNKYLSWTFIAHAAFQGFFCLMTLVMMGFFLAIPMEPGRGGPPPPRGMFVFMFGFMFVFYVVFTVPSIIAAYGLRKKKKWARMASIVAGVIGAMNVPVGTAACVYAMWFFLGENWKSVYPEVAYANDDKAEARQLAHERETRWTGYQTDEKGEIHFHTVEPPDWR